MVGKALFAFMACTVCTVFLAGCDKNETDVDTPVVDPVIKPISSDGQAFNVPVRFLGNPESELAVAVRRRAPQAEQDGAGSRMVVVAQNELEANGDAIIGAWGLGDFIVVLDPDYDALDRFFSARGMRLDLPVFGDASGNMLVCFNNSGCVYDVDDPFDGNGIVTPQKSRQDSDGRHFFVSGSNEYDAYLNPLVRFVNGIVNESVSTKGELADVAKTFDYQKVEHTYTIHLKKEIAHVALSSPDVVEASSQLTLRFQIYPLYAFEDQSANGDYYLVTAQSTIENGPMYLGSFDWRHGGVHSHICAYIFYKYFLNLEFEGSVKPVFDVTPNPSTTSVGVSHTEGMEWNIGGSVTGGFESGGPSAAVSLNGGVSFSNSTTITYPDLLIKNNYTSAGKVSYEYQVPDDLVGYMQGTHFHGPDALICSSNAEMSCSWVWRVSGTKDNGTDRFSVIVTPDITYTSMHFFTTGIGDGEFKDFTDAIADTEKTFKLNLTSPNRVPTGFWNLKNTFSAGEYVTDIRLYKPSSTTPEYSYTRNLAPGEEMKVNVATGQYIVKFNAGSNRASMKSYESVSPITISRAESTVSNSGLDIEFN